MQRHETHIGSDTGDNGWTHRSTHYHCCIWSHLLFLHGCQARGWCQALIAGRLSVICVNCGKFPLLATSQLALLQPGFLVSQKLIHAFCPSFTADLWSVSITKISWSYIFRVLKTVSDQHAHLKKIIWLYLCRPVIYFQLLTHNQKLILLFCLLYFWCYANEKVTHTR